MVTLFILYRYLYKNFIAMKVLIKKNDKLINIGEGKIYSKKQLKLNEFSKGIDANIGSAPDLKTAQITAQQMINRNPGVTSASADAGHLDGQQDYQSGEGIKLEIPVNANGKQLAQAQRLAKDQNADDAQITFVKQQAPSAINNNGLGESKIVEMRKNSIPFTKKELNSFLNSI